MRQEQVNTLVQIYNTMMQISTKGNDSRKMANCLDSLLLLINQIQQERNQKGELIDGEQ